MKSRKLIVLIFVLGFVAVLITLNSTIFTLQTVNINWLTTKYELLKLTDSDMESSITKGESIFLLSKSKISETLEKKYPYLRVVSIETKFPNKIVVHSAERESLYAVYMPNQSESVDAKPYAILDESGKVLTFTNSSIFAVSDLGAKPIRVFFNNMNIKSADFNVGEVIAVDTVESLLSQLSLSLRESKYSPTTSKGIFARIDIQPSGQDGGFEVLLETRSGLKLQIDDAGVQTTGKFLLALERYNYYHQEGVFDGVVKVWQNTQDDRIYACYFDKNVV